MFTKRNVPVDLEREPLTWADFVLVFPLIATEVVAAVIEDDEKADAALQDVANRLLEVGAKITNERSAKLVLALATQLISTEMKP